MGNRCFLIAFFLLACTGIWAREVVDTLKSDNGDRVIITYAITQAGEKFTVKFHDAKKWLGQEFKSKYKNPDEVVILFFDKMGVPKDKTRFSGIGIEAFMIPSGINFDVSEDGYYLLNNKPTLTLGITSEEPEELKIPIYLAHYEKKRRYEVFSRCEDLVIKLSKRKQAAKSNESTTKVTTQTITTEEEVEGTFTDADEASILVSMISEMLDEQKEYPFPEELKEKYSKLREMSYRIKDNVPVSSEIKDVLSAYKIKEEELKGKADSIARKAEMESKLAAQQEQARQDSIDAVRQQQSEKEKKRNFWLIIGAAILAALGFIGNQILQHLRNKNIMAMQEDVVKRAENEAKQRSKDMAQNQVNQAQNVAKRKARDSVNGSIGKIANNRKGNKSFSI